MIYKYMGLQDWIEKLRSKPVRERERIAVIATGFAFAVVLVIWLVSFSEMNRNENSEPSSSPVTNQLEDLKQNIGKEKQSIQDMMQSLPQASDLEGISEEGSPSNGSENQNQSADENQNNQPEIPQLP